MATTVTPAVPRMVHMTSTDGQESSPASPGHSARLLLLLLLRPPLLLLSAATSSSRLTNLCGSPLGHVARHAHCMPVTASSVRLPTI